MKTLNAKTFVATLAAAAAVTAVAAPAMAQPYGYDRDYRGYDARHDAQRWDRGYGNINRQQAQIEQTIRLGERRGDLTRHEARVLRGISNDIARLEVRYRAGGLSNWERQDLNRRLDRLERDVHLNLRDYQVARR